MQTLITQLRTQFPLQSIVQQRDNLAIVTIEKLHLYSLLQQLRDKHGFTHLVLLTAVDRIEQQQFQLTYLLCNRIQNQDIAIRVLITRDHATMESVHNLWPTAATYQRELREMFGIDFPESPGINDDFILEGWNDIPPYRRDFDTLKFSQENFNHRPGRESHDPQTYMKKQLYPDGENNG